MSAWPTPTHRQPRHPQPMMRLWLGSLAMLWVCTMAQAQTMPHQSPHTTVGAVNCASSTCHGSIEERTSTPVMQNEYTTWLRQDPHTQSHIVLRNEESRRIAKNLGLAQPAHEAKVCLDCHTHNPPAAKRGVRFDLSDGVGCEGCHGPAEQWIKTHVEPNASHARNVANGLYPTNEPYSVAKLCVSCHVGDATRPITHQIMGAGHPRLSMDVDTFMALLPQHYRIDKDWVERKGSFDSAKIWAMGQFAMSSNLLKIMADPRRNKQGIMPELMMFDCHACHSSMNKKGWAPDMASTPGQARLNDSSLLMVQAILKATAPDEARVVAQKIKAMHVAATSPAASLIDLEKAAAQLDAELEKARQKVAASSLNGSVLETILREQLNMAASRTYVDFADAEQAYMAIASMANAINNRGNSRLAQGVNSRLPKLLNVLKTDENYNRAAFEAEVAALKTAVGGL